MAAATEGTPVSSLKAPSPLFSVDLFPLRPCDNNDCPRRPLTGWTTPMGPVSLAVA